MVMRKCREVERGAVKACLERKYANCPWVRDVVGKVRRE